MTLLEMFKQLTEDEKIEFINLLIDVINDCSSNKKPSNPYTFVAQLAHLKKY